MGRWKNRRWKDRRWKDRRWKDRRRKPWRKISRWRRCRETFPPGRISRSWRRERERKIRRLCLLLLLMETLWLGNQRGAFLGGRYEITGVRRMSGEERPAGWFGIGADLERGIFYIFRQKDILISTFNE